MSGCLPEVIQAVLRRRITRFYRHGRYGRSLRRHHALKLVGAQSQNESKRLGFRGGWRCCAFRSLANLQSWWKFHYCIGWPGAFMVYQTCYFFYGDDNISKKNVTTFCVPCAILPPRCSPGGDAFGIPQEAHLRCGSDRGEDHGCCWFPNGEQLKNQTQSNDIKCSSGKSGKPGKSMKILNYKHAGIPQVRQRRLRLQLGPCWLSWCKQVNGWIYCTMVKFMEGYKLTNMPTGTTL